MDNLREVVSYVLTFVGLFVIITLGLWALWTLVAPALGLPKLGYWHFVGLYILIRGLLTDIGKHGKST